MFERLRNGFLAPPVVALALLAACGGGEAPTSTDPRCLNKSGEIRVRGSDAFREQIAEAIDQLPRDYESLVRCWLKFIFERGRATAHDGVFVRTGMFYWSHEPELGPKANAATLVHEAVHVRENAYDRPHRGRDGELTSLTVQLEALKAMDAPESHGRWIEEIIENIDDPAYQYWER